MKKWLMIVLLSMGLVMTPTQESKAIVWVVVKAAIKKVIMAIDLQIQRQQNKVIWLQNAQKTLENLMAKLKLEEIGKWTQKQKEQYSKYFDELNKVKTLIAYYQRIRSIGEKQLQLVREYRRAWGIIHSDRNFSIEEVEYMARVYNGILEETAKNLDQLTLVVNSFKTKMGDAKRLEIIDQVGEKVDQNYVDLLDFTNENALLSLRRTRDKKQQEQVRRMYGLSE